MFYVSLKGKVTVGPDNLFIHPYPGVTFSVEIIDQLLIGAFLLSHQRGQNRNLSRKCAGDVVCNPFRRACDDGDIVFRTVRCADPGKEQTQIIVDLGYGSNRTTGIF